MKLHYTAILSLAVGIFSGSPAQAQCEVALTADSSCNLPTTLHLSADFGFYQVEWYYAGNLVQSYTAAWDSSGSGVTVAGGNGGGPQLDQFRPYDLEVDDSSNLYIADGLVNNKRVLKWAPNATSGTMAADGIASPTPFDPNGLAFDYDTNFYIADDDSSRVFSWVPGAASGTVYAGGNGIGSAPNQFDNLNGICFDSSGNLFVADAFNFRLQQWAPGATSGTTIDDTLYGNIQFVDADLEGNIYVSDFNNSRILRYPPGGGTPVTVAGDPNGVGGAADSLLHFPEGVYVDGLKNIYIADYFNHRVQMWPAGATSGMTIGGGSRGDSMHQLNLPSGIRQDKWGNVYVADLLNYRVQKYSPAIVDTFSATQEGVYTVVIKAYNGCVITDSIAVYAGVNPEPHITVSGFRLSASAPYASYQWLKDGVAIPNATNEFYDVEANGDYQVAVTDTNGCMDTSAVYTIDNYTSIHEADELGKQITVYPNPTSDILHIDAPVPVKVSLLGVDGKVLRQPELTRHLDVAELAAGIYFLGISDTQGNRIKMERFVKQNP